MYITKGAEQILDQTNFLWEMIRSELEDAVGRENVDCSLASKLIHGVDCFWLSLMNVATRKTPPLPEFIVRPGSDDEVMKVLKIANYYKIPVTPFGGASGSQGGCLPVAGGISLDMKRMNRVLEFDEFSHTITVEAGINFQQLEWIANERGYSLMHYPSALTCGTVGGFLAHNGIGVLSTKYGRIQDQCLALEMATPGAGIIKTAPVPKHSSGPDIKGMCIGSEGTYGVFTKATFQLFKQPEVRYFRGFLFPNLHCAIEAGRKMLEEFKPSILRMYDEAETKSIIRKIVGVEQPGCFMNIAVEGMKAIADIELERACAISKECGGEDMGSEYGEKWWETKVTFFYPGHMFCYPKMYGTMDTVATFSQIEKIYWAMKHAVEDNFPGVEFIAHFSHWYEWGCMMYDRFIVERAPEDPEEALRLHNEIWNVGVRAALENGGVVNDHHGVGIKLGRLMKEQYGPSMAVFQALKKELDPNGIMNPFKMGV